MQYARELKFKPASARVIAITGSDANDAAFKLGALYRFSYHTTSAASTVPGAVSCRWGSSAATTADGGSDFTINAGESLITRATSATLHAIGLGGTGATGTLVASEIDEGV